MDTVEQSIATQRQQLEQSRREIQSRSTIQRYSGIAGVQYRKELTQQLTQSEQRLAAYEAEYSKAKQAAIQAQQAAEREAFEKEQQYKTAQRLASEGKSYPGRATKETIAAVKAVKAREAFMEGKKAVRDWETEMKKWVKEHPESGITDISIIKSGPLAGTVVEESTVPNNLITPPPKSASRVEDTSQVLKVDSPPLNRPMEGSGPVLVENKQWAPGIVENFAAPFDNRRTTGTISQQPSFYFDLPVEGQSAPAREPNVMGEFKPATPEQQKDYGISQIQFDKSKYYGPVIDTAVYGIGSMIESGVMVSNWATGLFYDKQDKTKKNTSILAQERILTINKLESEAKSDQEAAVETLNTRVKLFYESLPTPVTQEQADVQNAMIREYADKQAQLLGAELDAKSQVRYEQATSRLINIQNSLGLGAPTPQRLAPWQKKLAYVAQTILPVKPLTAFEADKREREAATKLYNAGLPREIALQKMAWEKVAIGGGVAGKAFITEFRENPAPILATAAVTAATTFAFSGGLAAVGPVTKTLAGAKAAKTAVQVAGFGLKATAGPGTAIWGASIITRVSMEKGYARWQRAGSILATEALPVGGGVLVGTTAYRYVAEPIIVSGVITPEAQTKEHGVKMFTTTKDHIPVSISKEVKTKYQPASYQLKTTRLGRLLTVVTGREDLFMKRVIVSPARYYIAGPSKELKLLVKNDVRVSLTPEESQLFKSRGWVVSHPRKTLTGIKEVSSPSPRVRVGQKALDILTGKRLGHPMEAIYEVRKLNLKTGKVGSVIKTYTIQGELQKITPEMLGSKGGLDQTTLKLLKTQDFTVKFKPEIKVVKGLVDVGANGRYYEKGIPKSEAQYWNKKLVGSSPIRTGDRVILIDASLSRQEAVKVLGHELGHAFSEVTGKHTTKALMRISQKAADDLIFQRYGPEGFGYYPTKFLRKAELLAEIHKGKPVNFKVQVIGASPENNYYLERVVTTQVSPKAPLGKATQTYSGIVKVKTDVSKGTVKVLETGRRTVETTTTSGIKRRFGVPEVSTGKTTFIKEPFNQDAFADIYYGDKGPSKTQSLGTFSFGRPSRTTGEVRVTSNAEDTQALQQIKKIRYKGKGKYATEKVAVTPQISIPSQQVGQRVIVRELPSQTPVNTMTSEQTQTLLPFAIRESQRTVPTQTTIPKNVPTSISIEVPVQTPVPATIPKPITSTVPTTTTIQTPVITPVQVPIPTLTPITTPTPVPTTIDVPNVKPSVATSSSLSKAIGKFKAGYKTFVYRRGKKTFLPGIRTRESAIKTGESIVLTGPEARFGIEKTKVPVPGYDINYKPSEKIFRTFTYRKKSRVPLKDEWIQRTRPEQGLRTGRLSTKSEVMSLVSSRRKRGKSLWRM